MEGALLTQTHLFSADLPTYEGHLADVYRFAVRSGGITGAEAVSAALGLEIAMADEAIDRLVGCGMLRPDHTAGALLVAGDPEDVAALLISPMEREIYQRHEMIARIRAQSRLFHAAYADAPGPAGAASAPVGRITGAAAVQGYLNVVGEGCHAEALVLQAGDPAQSEHLLRVCAALLERGIRVRIICPHRSRADLASRVKLRSTVEIGAQVRTVSHLPCAAFVADRSLAVLLGEDGDEASASSVRDPGVVDFLMVMFDHLWDGATPVAGPELGYAEAADDLHQCIAGLMAKGFTDEVIARKLGMSVRTCRRHIAALMSDLDAVSRFQAGTLAAKRLLADAG
jgi:hypothetical protein